MKKIFITTLSGIFFCNIAYAESYFFKECKISSSLMGNYTINIETQVNEEEKFLYYWILLFQKLPQKS